MPSGTVTGTAVAGWSAMDQLVALRALIAGRTGDPAAADEQLGWARDIAVRLAASGIGGDAGFGAAQVALYEIAVSIETAGARGPRRSGRGAGPGQLERAS
jgi:hypothetical protein